SIDAALLRDGRDGPRSLHRHQGDGSSGDGDAEGHRHGSSPLERRTWDRRIMPEGRRPVTPKDDGGTRVSLPSGLSRARPTPPGPRALRGIRPREPPGLRNAGTAPTPPFPVRRGIPGSLRAATRSTPWPNW